jgi:glycosyltransferase involved in cell wall biosynthesis
MNCPLMVFSAWVGVASETFIRRHMQDLLPGRTGIVAWHAAGSQASKYPLDGPVLLLSSLPRRRLGRRVIAAVARGLGRGAPPGAEAVKQFIQEHHIQVILAEYLDFGVDWVDFARDLSVKFFAHAHGYDVSRLLRARKWRSAYLRYNRADGVISMSQLGAARLVSLGVAANKIHVIPYGVDVPDEPARRPVRAKTRCLAVGRMVRKKAPLLTLEAFRRASNACATLHLDYVGGGELLPAAQQFVREHALGDRVTLHGAQPYATVQRLLEDADIFLQHSVTDPKTGDEEGLPVAILEAMAHSLPVVSTEHAGIPEAVQQGVTGYLVDEGDCAGMAERLMVLARDAELRHSLGLAGWQRAKARFSWERERDNLLEVLDLNAKLLPV